MTSKGWRVEESLPRVGRVEFGAPNVANGVDLVRKGLQQAGSLLQNKMAAPEHVTVKYVAIM